MGVLVMADISSAQTSSHQGALVSGAEAISRSGFAVLAGKRVGLIANQTSRVGSVHLADLLSKAPDLKLTAILSPEHGFRGEVEAGAKVGDTVDAKTGVPVFSLYGASRKPTPAMLRNVDVLVFDIQDIGTRFYTYISTLGLAMQAAAAARIPLMVLDRPNPLGGDYISGFVLEAAHTSFVGQYPIPIVHGLTVGELARMIKGEAWLDGLGALDLMVVPIEGWRRAMRWPDLKRGWVTTSPNVPTFETALVYPGVGIAGEGLKVNEGRGTPTPFSLFGAPWADGALIAERLNAAELGGVHFTVNTYTPRSIPNVALRPRFEGKAITGVRIVVTDPATFAPLETGVHVLAALFAEARAKGVGDPVADLTMLNALAGTPRLHRMLADGHGAAAIIAAWAEEVARFRMQRARYLLYP
jgi:uncharacterized protein YbbC (DUF1343 family)